MNATELRKLKEQIQTGHEATMKALDHLTSLSEPPKSVAAIVGTGYINKSLAAENLIKATPDTFTRPSIAAKMSKMFRPDGDYREIVGGVINKLLQRNPAEIEVVIKGKGSRSGVYRYKKPVK